MLPKETPHYSGGNFDLEVNLSIGWTEVVGNAFRQQHDLMSHEEFSKTKMTIQHGNEHVIPFVIEPSIGVGRTLYCVLENCYRETDDRDWTWFQFPASISPYDVQVNPLMRKDGLEEKAQEVFEELRGSGIEASFDVTGNDGYTYTITLPSTDYTITRVSGTETMTINTFTSDPSGTGTLTGGTETVNVGATLNVNAGQVGGTYTNATGFDVTVNYN